MMLLGEFRRLLKLTEARGVAVATSGAEESANGTNYCFFVYGNWRCVGERCKSPEHRPDPFISP
jgi:hypothetical protein